MVISYHAMIKFHIVFNSPDDEASVTSNVKYFAKHTFLPLNHCDVQEIQRHITLFVTFSLLAGRTVEKCTTLWRSETLKCFVIFSV